MSQPLFSIICTVKNRASLIRQAVESVLAQDDEAVEIVVQDGVSTDGTLEILREYGDRLNLVSTPDRGAVDGLFRALRRARGEFWGSCFSDERLATDAVSWARSTFAAHPELGAIYGCAEGIDYRGATVSRHDAGEFVLENLLTYRQLPPFVASFFRMASYRQLDLWRDTGGGEIDLWCRFAVRFAIRRFPQLVAFYGVDRSTLSNQLNVYEAEREPRLANLRRLFREDPAGRRFQHLEGRATAGYHLRVAGMLVRNGSWERAAASWHEARLHWPGCASPWLEDGAQRVETLEAQLRMRSTPVERQRRFMEHLHEATAASCDELLRFAPEEADRLRLSWLQYTVAPAFNVWRLLRAAGIGRVAIFGGEGWGTAIYRQLAAADIDCTVVIDNNESVRRAQAIPVPYLSQPAFVAGGPRVDAVLSSLQGDHDRDILPALQDVLGRCLPVVSWKTLCSLLSTASSTDDDHASMKAAAARAAGR
jgi:hypothetical protein